LRRHQMVGTDASASYECISHCSLL
jgi:hypothetical protein